MLTALLAGVAASCNSSDDDYYFEFDASDYSAVTLSSFSLQKNDSVLMYIDTVYFSVDINKAEVFNADSLPKGTDISRLQVVIGLPSVSEAKLIVPSKEGKEVPDTINYLENPNDSVDFSQGPITLRVVSLDKNTKLDYKIKVNVHNMVPDSLWWNQTASFALPGGVTNPTDNGVVEIDGQVISFVTNGGKTVRSVSANPATGIWSSDMIVLPSDAVVGSVAAADGNLYMTSTSGVLYKSLDKGINWSSTGTSMHHIYGGMENTIVGARKNADGSWTHVTYPASVETAVPADCPISATSASVTYTTEWAAEPMMIVLGGRCADNSLTGHVWAFDGGQWADITQEGIPAAEGVTMVPYFTFRLATSWVATKQTVLLAFGGKCADGTLSKTTYVSVDRGVHWTKAGKLLQLPDYIPAMWKMHGIVAESELTSRAAGSGWTLTGDRPLDGWYTPIYNSSNSRAVTPITSWDCPYIYLFGGLEADGSMSTTVWRGVINRLSFKPLQ